MWRDALWLLLPVCLYALTVLAGVLLWRGHRFGRPLGIALFASQIPIVQLPSVAAHWYTGLKIGPSFTLIANVWETRMSFGLGTGGQWEWADFDQTMLGINLFACVALLYLLEGVLRREYGRRTA